MRCHFSWKLYNGNIMWIKSTSKIFQVFRPHFPRNATKIFKCVSAIIEPNQHAYNNFNMSYYDVTYTLHLSQKLVHYKLACSQRYQLLSIKLYTTISQESRVCFNVVVVLEHVFMYPNACICFIYTVLFCIEQLIKFLANFNFINFKAFQMKKFHS